MAKFEIGDYITNGMSAGVVLEIQDHNPIWKASGVRIRQVPLSDPFGWRGIDFVPDYLSWWKITLYEWTSCNRDLEQRYVWSEGWMYLQRELRKVEDGTNEVGQVVASGTVQSGGTEEA